MQGAQRIVGAAATKIKRNAADGLFTQPSASMFTGHDKEGLGFKTLVIGPQPVAIVVLLYIDYFFNAADNVQRHIVVAPVPQGTPSAGLSCCIAFAIA